MTPELGYVRRLNTASHSVYILAARTIATQRVAVSSEGFEATDARLVGRKVAESSQVPSQVAQVRPGAAQAFQRTGLDERGEKWFSGTPCPEISLLFSLALTRGLTGFYFIHNV